MRKKKMWSAAFLHKKSPNPSERPKGLWLVSSKIVGEYNICGWMKAFSLVLMLITFHTSYKSSKSICVWHRVLSFVLRSA